MIPAQKILIVDDNPEVRRLLSMTLDPSIREIHDAPNAAEGLERARSVKPDLILLDIMMPGGNGLDLCRQIKSDPLLRTSFVVIITARGQSSDIAQGKEAGADAYITKPFSPTTLLELVEQPECFAGYGFDLQ
jgi:CheY-like chemotaxis protein